MKILELHYPVIQFLILLYIELSNSFPIGGKRTVNFRNQRPWRQNLQIIQ